MFAWRRTSLRRSVLINLKTGTAVRGVLWAKRGPLLVIRNASVLVPKSQWHRADGEVVIERDNVDWHQIIEPDAAKPPAQEG